jgi:hypothetical protein
MRFKQLWKRYKDLADETKLPEDRRQSCQKDYGKISMSWDTVLKPHRRAAEQAKIDIETTYGEGNLDAYAKCLLQHSMSHVKGLRQ